MATKNNRTSGHEMHKRDKRQAENSRDTMREQNIGQDDATGRATRRVKGNAQSGRGGGSNAAGEKQKQTKFGARRRTGSRSNAS